MYDPAEIVDIEIGGKPYRCRLLTERQVKEVARITAEARGTTGGELVARHDLVNRALAVGLVDFDPQDMTFLQKLSLADDYPWAATMGELERLKKAAASPSASPTRSSAPSASPPSEQTPGDAPKK